MKWALVIHDEPQMAEFLAGILAEKLRLTAERIVAVRNFADVHTQVLAHHELGECAVMVVSFSAPSDPSQPPALEGNRAGALAFFADIRCRRADVPFVFVARLIDASSQAVCNGMESASLLGVNAIHRTLPAAVGQLVLGEQSGKSKAKHEVDVDITLRLGGASTWGMRGAEGSALEDAQAFAISDTELKELILDSVVAADTKSRVLIERLGTKMYRTLFANNLNSGGLELALRHNIRVRDMNYLEAARFRFHLDSGTNELLVETLAKPLSPHGPEVHYWMLSSPIYRKYEGHGERKPLFKDRTTRTGPIDCLVIQGNAQAFSAGPPLNRDFAAIALADKETRWLQDEWTTRQGELKINAVKVMRPDDYPGLSYGKEVRKTLAERQWNLVHYAGHSAIVGKRGYLVLGDGPDDLLDIDTFARDVRGAQFIFLNSCSSANGTFVARLVEKNIPAVAGYAWALDDRHALAFSRKFYQELFEGEGPPRFLEYSFMRAKAHLFDKFDDQPAWAAPLLFMQTSQADRD